MEDRNEILYIRIWEAVETTMLTVSAFFCTSSRIPLEYPLRTRDFARPKTLHGETAQRRSAKVQGLAYHVLEQSQISTVDWQLCTWERGWVGCSEMKADENTQTELWWQVRWSKYCIPGTGWLNNDFVIKIIFLRQTVLLKLFPLFGAGREVLLSSV